jgi:regulator of sigma E protease
MQFLSWLYVIAAVVLLFGATVFVHEFGHFLTARWRGLKVDGFSIGFGPKLFGWSRKGIDYAWRLIPAGGFVALPQMVTSEALEGTSQAAANLPPVSPWSKVLVALAGPMMNALFAFALATAVYFLGLPVRVNPAIIGGVEPGSPEAKLGLRAGDRILAVDGKPVRSWEEVQRTTALAATNPVPVMIQRNGLQTTYYLTAKVNDALDLKLLDLEPAEHPLIEEVRPGSPADRAGLKAGDEVMSFAGVPVVGQQQLVGLVRKRPGQVTQLEVRRGQQRLTLTATPKFDPAAKAGVLGVMIAPNTTSVYQLQKPGPLPWNLVAQICRQTFETLAALVHSKQTGVGVKDLSGPPGILAMLALELKTDYRLALKFMVLLNISLAILNLLPVPVLDGGHIAMAIVEKLRGCPLSPRVQQFATTAFGVLLISFMLYVSYNDIVRRFPLFKSILQQHVQIESGSGKSPASVPAK